MYVCVCIYVSAPARVIGSRRVLLTGVGVTKTTGLHVSRFPLDTKKFTLSAQGLGYLGSCRISIIHRSRGTNGKLIRSPLKHRGLL